MNSPQVKSLITQLIDWYGIRKSGLLSLDVVAIPEHDINNLCALILSQDDDLATEAAGPDNPEFYTAILPAMLRALQMPKNGFENEEFRNVQTSAIRNYLMTRIGALIEKALEELNEDRVCHVSLIWDRGSEKALEMPNAWPVLLRMR